MRKSQVGQGELPFINYREVKGTIDANGTSSSTEFTSRRLNEGVYTVTFTPPFHSISQEAQGFITSLRVLRTSSPGYGQYPCPCYSNHSEHKNYWGYGECACPCHGNQNGQKNHGGYGQYPYPGYSNHNGQKNQWGYGQYLCPCYSHHSDYKNYWGYGECACPCHGNHNGQKNHGGYGGCSCLCTSFQEQKNHGYYGSPWPWYYGESIREGLAPVQVRLVKFEETGFTYFTFTKEEIGYVMRDAAVSFTAMGDVEITPPTPPF